MSAQATATTLLRLYADGQLPTAGLTEGLWSQEAWPWAPPATPPEQLLGVLEDWRCALDVHLLLALEPLDALLAEVHARVERCRKDPLDGLCISCAGAWNDVDTAITTTARALVRDVPAAAAAGLLQVDDETKENAR